MKAIRGVVQKVRLMDADGKWTDVTAEVRGPLCIAQRAKGRKTLFDICHLNTGLRVVRDCRSRTGARLVMDGLLSEKNWNFDREAIKAGYLAQLAPLVIRVCDEVKQGEIAR